MSAIYDAAPAVRGRVALRVTIGVAITLVLIGAWLAISLAFAAALRQHFSPTFVVDNESNTPALRVGDRLAVDPEQGIGRGDLIAFRDPRDKHSVLIRRVIAVEADTVDIHDGFVFRDGVQVDEPYAQGLTRRGTQQLPLEVPLDSVYVLGDNRPDSEDSRHFGTVHRRDVLGPVVSIYWPESRARDL